MRDKKSEHFWVYILNLYSLISQSRLFSQNLIFWSQWFIYLFFWMWEFISWNLYRCIKMYESFYFTILSFSNFMQFSYNSEGGKVKTLLVSCHSWLFSPIQLLIYFYVIVLLYLSFISCKSKLFSHNLDLIS